LICLAEIFHKIRRAVSQIPKGKVSTYGLLAEACGIKDARLVGWSVWGNKDPKIPCHRIVNKDGYLAEKFSLGGWKEQRKRLENDGVEFSEKKRVNLKKYLFMTKN